MRALACPRSTASACSSGSRAAASARRAPTAASALPSASRPSKLTADRSGSRTAARVRCSPSGSAMAFDLPYQQLIEAAPDGIIVCDQTGKILLINKQVEQMFGYSRAELLGASVDKL